MQQIALAAMIAALLSIAGCAQMFTAKTKVAVETPDCKAWYESDKDQQGLEGEVCGGKIRVDKSGTPEAVIAAVLQVQLNLLQRLDALVQKLSAAPLAAGS